MAGGGLIDDVHRGADEVIVYFEIVEMVGRLTCNVCSLASYYGQVVQAACDRCRFPCHDLPPLEIEFS
jgi:hypothetical protein